MLLDKLNKRKFIYEECLTRMKKTKNNIFATQHFCEGRVVIRYEEDRNYVAVCENCGDVHNFKNKSQDSAILTWNDYCRKEV